MFAAIPCVVVRQQFNVCRKSYSISNSLILEANVGLCAVGGQTLVSGLERCQFDSQHFCQTICDDEQSNMGIPHVTSCMLVRECVCVCLRVSLKHTVKESVCLCLPDFVTIALWPISSLGLYSCSQSLMSRPAALATVCAIAWRLFSVRLLMVPGTGVAPPYLFVSRLPGSCSLPPRVLCCCCLLQLPESGHPMCEEERSEGRHPAESHPRDQPLQRSDPVTFCSSVSWLDALNFRDFFCEMMWEKQTFYDSGSATWSASRNYQPIKALKMNAWNCWYRQKYYDNVTCSSLLRLTMSSKRVKAKQQLTFISVSVVIGCHIYYYLCIQQDVTLQIHSFHIGMSWYKLIV